MLAIAPVCLFMTGCGALARRGPVDTSLAQLAPSDTVALVGIRMDQIRTVPLYPKLKDRGHLPNMNEFRTESGFDPSSDIRELLIASDGESALAMAHGTFNSRPSGDLQTSQYRGFTLYAKNPGEAMVFLDKNTVVGGQTAAVHAAIDRYKSGAHEAPQALLSRAEALPAESSIWAVVVGWHGAPPERLRGMGDLSNIDRMLRSVSGASITIDLRQGISVRTTGDCRQEADARDLGDSLRGLAALVRMAVPKSKPDLQRGMDSIHINQEGAVVRVNADIPEDLAERLLM